jgi:signal transduction histidine kinase
LEQLKHLALPLVVTPEGLEVPMAQYLPTAEGASEVELQNAEGERTICILGVNQLAGSDGQANLHYAWAMDITARRQGEEALLRAVEDSQIANRAKTEFLANMSHELRTPLNAIIGFSEVIGGEIFGPLGHQQYSEYVRDIHSSGEHLLAIINDILDLSRVEAGVTTLMEAEVDLPTLIDDSVRIAQGRVDSGQTEITTRIDASPVHLLCDSRLLKQVLLNILSNALKFTPDHGEVRLATTRSRHGDLLITVADDGCGIPTDRLEDVLQPFTQIEDSYKRCHEGAGLGLPLSKQFMELHGGTLEIDSDHGRGTIVTLCLPATRLREGDAVVNSANV